MAKKSIKGLTVEINGDTTKLGKALENVHKKSSDLSSELGSINRLLKLDPSNTELLAQKQKVLTEAISATEEKLNTLREAEKQVQAQFEKGEVSEAQYRELQREIISTEDKLNQYKNAAKEAAEAAKNLGKSSDSLTNAVEEQESRLKELKSRYIDVVAAQGKNSAEAKALAREMSDLSGALKDNKKELANAEKAADKAAGGLGGFSNSADKAKKSCDTLGAKLSSVLKAGLETVATVAVAASAATLKLGTEVVSSYADYEQLVGGIETLFGAGGQSLEEYAASVGKTVDEVAGEYDSLIAAQTTLLEKANDAYKTAGLSANDYMDTVTSFSASLISSLGGDTEKAVEYANIAITDMADNANKMGSSMEDIQNAYQGFAKQNYTMLDNLKLGYGGTKEEMQRLLENATALSGIEYDIDSYADVVSAIHVIQEEMGVAGAAATEVEETISGSISSLQAALRNLVTGLGDSEADIESLCDNVVEAFQNVLANITPIIQNISKSLPAVADTLLEAVAEILPTLLETATALFTTILEKITELFPSLIEVVASLLPQILTTITTMLPQLVTAGVQIIMNILNGLTSAIPEIIQALVNMIPLLVDALVYGIPQIIQAGVDLLLALVEAIPQIIPPLVAALPDIVLAIIDGLITAIPQLLEGAIQFLTAIIDAIPLMIELLVPQIPAIISTVVNGLLSAIPQLLEGAVQFLMAIVDAIPLMIESLIPQIPTIITTIITELINAIPTLLEGAVTTFMAIVEAIPEIVVELGNAVPDIITGLVNGLLDGVAQVGKAALELGSSILDSIRDFFGIHSPSTVMEDQGNFLVSGMVNGLANMPDEILNTISGALDNVQQWGVDLAEEVQTTSTDMLDSATSTLDEMPDKIMSVISGAIEKVSSWGTDLTNKVKSAAINMLSNAESILTVMPDRIMSVISVAITNVSAWGINMVSKAKAGMKNVVTSVISTLKELPVKVLSIGSDLVTGLWNGINDKLQWLKNKISSFTSSVLTSIKSFFGVHSPSTETAWIGDMLDQGLAEGIEDNANAPLEAMASMGNDLLNEAVNLNGLTLQRQINHTFSSDSTTAKSQNSLLSKLDSILTAIEHGQVLMLDGDALVGGTVDRYNNKMGLLRLLAERGAL